MFAVNIYIESNIKGFKEQYGWYGAVVEYKKSNGEPVTRERFGCRKATANKLLLVALVDALNVLTVQCDVKVYVNSDYITGMVAQDAPRKWELNGWMTAKNEPVVNKQEWKELLDKMRFHQIVFINSKGHSYSEWLQSEIRSRKDVGKYTQHRIEEEVRRYEC